VLATLDRLSQREPSLVAVLPRQPGTKESRYMHLLSGSAPAVEASPVRTVSGPAADDDRIAILESIVAELKREVAEIRQQLATFRKQFE
jgi:uncharacterized protein YceH (UPF0502 family)